MPALEFCYYWHNFPIEGSIGRNAAAILIGRRRNIYMEQLLWSKLYYHSLERNCGEVRLLGIRGDPGNFVCILELLFNCFLYKFKLLIWKYEHLTFHVDNCQFLDFLTLLTRCDGQFYDSTWLGHRMPRYCIKHFFFFCIFVRVFWDDINIWRDSWVK